MDRTRIRTRFLPSMQKIHRCMKSGSMSGFLQSEIILLNMYYRSADAAQTPMRVCELGRCSHISPTALSRSLRQLEADGLIRRTMDPHDRRSLRVELTDRGIRRAEELDEHNYPCLDRIFQAMGEQDACEFVRLTEIFAGLLEQEIRLDNVEERRVEVL